MTEEEMKNTFAGNGTKALSIIGTILGGLSLLGDGSILSAGASNAASSDNYVSKETFDLSMQLSDSKRDNAILTAELNTEKKMVEVYNSLNDKINRVVTDQTAINSAQAVTNSAVTSTLAVAQNNINQLMGLTKLGIPNGSLCPGYGNVTITPSTTAAA